MTVTEITENLWRTSPTLKFLLTIVTFLALVDPVFGQTYTVTNTNSSGPGSLYDAISQASSFPGGSTITFNIPGPGVHVIDVGASPLPHVQKLFIDGYSQPGAHPNTLAVGDDAVILIQIDGGGVASRDGFYVTGFTHLRGLAITGCDTAILLADPFGQNVIDGNFIGLTPAGETAANQTGILVATDATIGGNAPAARNVISGNGTGISMAPRGATAVSGNYIGTDPSGTVAVPNTIGLLQQSGSPSISVLIGGQAGNSGNLISGNGYGIKLGLPRYTPEGIPFSNGANYAVVAGNLIGTSADGKSPLGNRFQGIGIFDGTNNTIGGTDPASGNTIAFNGTQGITVENFVGNASGNRILSNSIYGNGIANIDLKGDGGTPNDVYDNDDGPNGLQNYPYITGSSVANGTATINGSLISTPNAQFTIQFFADSRSFATPGQTFLGSTSVTTDANGNATFAGSFPVSDPNVVFDATATSANGDTSELFYKPALLANISTRLRVQNGENVLIAGFIMRNQGRLVLQALGPSITINGAPVAGTLQDPTLELYDAKGILVAQNDNWGKDPNASRLGPLAPRDDREAALSIDLPDGAYTAVVRGKNGATGIALVAAWIAGGFPELANISTRGFVDTGDNVMIAGITVTNISQGGLIPPGTDGLTRFVIRAIGPSLDGAGISKTLLDPTLELHDRNGATIATNDNWKENDEATVRATGLAPQKDTESVILAALPRGQYTAVVQGKAGGTGVAVVEVYNLR